MRNIQSMRTFHEFRDEMLKDPKRKKAYDELEPEFALIGKIIEKRAKEGLTQKEIARRMHTKQSAISRFESGNSNPTMNFMYRLADALGVEIEFKIKEVK